MSRDEALSLVQSTENPSAATVKTLAPDSDLYLKMMTVMDHRLMESPHSFQLTQMQCVSVPADRSSEFKHRISDVATPNPRLLFHGTTKTNHPSIYEKGFLLDKEHFGDTDAGYIGKGVYLSPHPEYSAAYIKNTSGVRRFNYQDPVEVGKTVDILGCVGLVGNTKRLYKKDVGCSIQTGHDSHWAWVHEDGAISSDEGEQFAMEYAIKEPKNIYPRFAFTLKRVTREVIWVDPNIENAENSRYVCQMRKTEGVALYATSSSAKALRALKKEKKDTEYRAVTAGRDGEDFVKKLRAEGVHCKVLVFCNAVNWHKQWARKFSNIEVTRSAQRMLQFATWK